MVLQAAIAFMLAHPYGAPRIISSYFFNNINQGPPADRNENILSPTINQVRKFMILTVLFRCEIFLDIFVIFKKH